MRRLLLLRLHARMDRISRLLRRSTLLRVWRCLSHLCWGRTGSLLLWTWRLRRMGILLRMDRSWPIDRETLMRHVWRWGRMPRRRWDDTSLLLSLL